MASPQVLAWPAQYWLLIRMWIRSSLAYPTSFVLMTVGFALITGLDFVAVLLMFSHIESFAGFGLAEMALLYATAAMSLGIADLALGEIERVGNRIRSGEVDVWLDLFGKGVRGDLAADNFALRRIGKPSQATVVLVGALVHLDLDWTAARVVVLATSMVTGALIFGSIFVLGAAFQFVTNDAAQKLGGQGDRSRLWQRSAV